MVAAETTQLEGMARAAPSAVSRDEINAHMLGKLFRRVRPLLISNIGMAWLLVALLWGHADPAWLVLWAAALSAWTGVRFLIARIYLRSPRGVSETRRWTTIFSIGSGIGGLFWGTSVVFFAGFAPQDAQPALMFVVGGLSTAALTGYSNNLMALAAFACPAPLPYGLSLIWLGGSVDWWIAGFFGFWMLLLWVMAQGLHAGFRDSVALQLRNSSLAQSLATALERAQAANIAKTRFLGNMSHELRTPLNAIIGYSEMIVHQVFGPLGNERYETYAGGIHDSGRHLLHTLQEILDLSELEAGEAELEEEWVGLNAVIDEVVGEARAIATEKGVGCSTQVPPGLPPVRADRAKLRRLLDNLVANAIAYTPEGGSVSVEASRRSGEGVLMTVRDTGVGMTPETIDRVTVPFAGLQEREPELRHGGADGGHTHCGLGLPLARLLVELHGGSLTLESRLGAGTVARVTLPERRVSADTAVSLAAE